MLEIHNFPPISTAEWMEKIQKDLKGADYERKLVWRSPEGFNVQPFYRREDLEQLKYLDTLPGSFPYVRGNAAKGNDWYVRQNIDVTDVAATNKKVLDILNKGITSVGFCLGQTDITAATFETLLKDVCLDCIEINITAASDKLVETAQLFTAYAKSKDYNLADIKGSLNFDILGRLLRTGSTCGDDMVSTAKTLIETTKELPNFRVITVNAKNFNNAGAYIVQELAFGLNMGNEYMSALTEAGVDAADVASNIKFDFGIGSNYFMELTKFRAGRMLWAKIVEAYGAKDAAKMNVNAETSQWNKTIYDNHVNLLRTQTETMSAALGGVDSITVLPFDSCYKMPSDFSERIARNQQLLLKEESHFEKIADPAGGSYYLETLTDTIAKNAWDLFVTVEDKGGFVAALKEGFIQAQVKESADKRRKAVATRRENLLGTNQFPNFTETKKKDVDEAKAAAHCSCGCKSVEKEVEPLEYFRGSEEFEKLRLSIEAKEETPTVFLLKVGHPAMRQARAQFVANFFGCAGFQILENLGYNTVAEGVEDAKKSDSHIVVICSSDDEYATAAPEAYEALKDSAEFVVAGAPACTDELKEKGITNFVHVRSNLLGELKRYVELV